MVTHWSHAGRIVLVDGKVDVHQSDAMLGAFAEAARRARAPRARCAHCGAPAAPQPFPRALAGVLGAVRLQLLTALNDHLVVLEVQFEQILKSAAAEAIAAERTEGISDAGAPAERSSHGR